MTNRPVIKLWDLETGFNVVNLFSLFQPGKYIHYSAIEQERYIICCGVKELGVDEVATFAINDTKTWAKDPTNDKELVKWILDELSDADVLIAHNGDHFDMKYINTRAIFWGYDPLPPIPTIDTLKMARGKFNFNSNRLDYLAQFLGVGAKINAPQALWGKALHGDSTAVDSIVDYNIGDVHLLEKVYTKLAPYCPSKLNMALYSDEEEVCPLCGSEDLEKRGFATKKTGVYQRYRCTDCGSWSQGTTSLRRAKVK